MNNFLQAVSDEKGSWKKGVSQWLYNIYPSIGMFYYCCLCMLRKLLYRIGQFIGLYLFPFAMGVIDQI